MHKVEPKIFILASTEVNQASLDDYLSHIGAYSWSSDAPSSVEEIVEVMARSCYKSFEPSLNLNVTRVRKSNASHLATCLKVDMVLQWNMLGYHSCFVMFLEFLLMSWCAIV